MRVIIVGLVLVGVIFLGNSFCLANGGGPAPEEVKELEITPLKKVEEPVIFVPVIEPSTQKAPLKQPEFAALLSAICPGLGQFYNGDLGKAVFMGSIEGLCWLIITKDMDGIGIFGLAMGRLISSMDAHYSATQKNKGLSLKIDNEKVLIAIKTEF